MLQEHFAHVYGSEQVISAHIPLGMRLKKERGSRQESEGMGDEFTSRRE